MSAATAAGPTAAAAAAAAIANAIKASGVLVRVEPEDFLVILSQVEDPLVVQATSTFLGTRHKYLVGYKGLAFFCKSKQALPLPGTAQIVRAKTIWTPQ